MQNNDKFLEWKEKLKAKCSIVSIISKYLTLSRKGKTYWACCPFHHEKTPSFAVNEIGQYYHCFGCGVGGDVINFVQKMEGIDYMDAVKMLARDVNIELPKFEFEDEEILKAKKQRDKLIEICTETAKFYYKKLNESVGYKARQYLEKRKVERETIVKMGLGYSPDYNSLPTYLKSKGYSIEDMVLAGVVSQNTDTKKVYDAMAKRLVFPIFNSNSKVCGFSGRAMEDGAYAKYKNTTGTPIFNKSTIMYGLNLLRKARVENKNYALLVEGQMDVISCHQAGFTNAIATLGTAFNDNHVRVLMRFVDSVIVCFDGDNAGRNAAVKCLEPLMKGNFEIKIISIKDDKCKDPDEFIKLRGKDEFQKLIDNAQNVWEFEINQVSSQYDLNDKIALNKFLTKALEIVDRIPGFAQKEIYMKQISNIAHINLDVLEREYRNNQRLKQNDVKESDVDQMVEIKEKEDQKITLAETFILASLLHNKDYADKSKNYIFTKKEYSDFYEYLKSNDFPIISKIYDRYDVENINWLKNLIYFNFEKINKPNELFVSYVKMIKSEKLLAKQQELTKKLGQANGSEKIELLKQIQEISKLIQKGKMED